jgi:hypothetical protein
MGATENGACLVEEAQHLSLLLAMAVADML